MSFFNEVAAMYRLAPAMPEDTYLPIPDLDDRGLLDVLVTFTKSQGFSFRDDHPALGTRRFRLLPRYDQDVVRSSACIHIGYQEIHIPTFDYVLDKPSPKFAQAAYLAHELGHLFAAVTGAVSNTEAVNEQVAELSSCRILFDYGYDIRLSSATYIYRYRASDDRLLMPYVNEFSELTYQQFERELEGFLHGQ